MPTISLREISAGTVRAICELQVAPGQVGHVAPNAISIAQAHFEPAMVMKAIYADEEPVGFLMWRPGLDSAQACYLRRFMIDRAHQAKGYGKQAMILLLASLREQDHQRLETSVIATPTGPLEFYRSLGFSQTSKTLPNGERVLTLQL